MIHFLFLYMIPVIPILVQIPPKCATKWPRNRNGDSLRIGIGPPLIGSLAEAGEKTDEEARGRSMRMPTAEKPPGRPRRGGLQHVRQLPRQSAFWNGNHNQECHIFMNSGSWVDLMKINHGHFFRYPFPSATLSQEERRQAPHRHGGRILHGQEGGHRHRVWRRRQDESLRSSHYLTKYPFLYSAALLSGY